MVWTRRFILFEGRTKKVDEIHPGKPIFKDDARYQVTRRKKIRQKNIAVMGWSLWIISVTIFFYVILRATGPMWFLMANGPPLILLVGSIADLMQYRRLDSQVVIHEKGVVLKLPYRFMYLITFLPFDQLSAIERKNDQLIFRGHRRKWLYWVLQIEDIGENGVETIMKRFDGWPEDQVPPRLIVWGPEGRRAEKVKPVRKSEKL
jgi:hypothetical protein